MEIEDIYRSLEELFGKIPKNVNIFEDQIDIDVQMSYFEASRKCKAKETDIEEITELQSKLFDDEVDGEEKKEILIKLSNIDDVEAFRAIEKYSNYEHNDLKDWTSLALQDSRLSLESYLLDEDQIIISTGLGGKGNKLRYFLAFSTNNNEDFTDLQQRLLTKELEFSFRKTEGEIENIEFHTRFCLLTALIPMSSSINKIISSTIDECNQIGNFLETKFVVTNVKILTVDDIYDHWDDVERSEDDE